MGDRECARVHPHALLGGLVSEAGELEVSYCTHCDRVIDSMRGVSSVSLHSIRRIRMVGACTEGGINVGGSGEGSAPPPGISIRTRGSPGTAHSATICRRG
eukprot:scaffold124187_cov31-Tisochrysis_lutea.AAC.1